MARKSVSAPNEMIDLKGIGEDLRYMRLSLNLNEFDAAKKVGILQSQVSSFERGGRDLLDSASGLRYTLSLYNTWQQCEFDPILRGGGVPFVWNLLSVMTGWHDVSHFDISPARDTFNLDHMAMMAGAREAKDIRMLAARQLRRFRKIFHTETPVQRIATSLGCTRETIDRVERGESDPVRSAAAIRYIMRYVAPVLSHLTPWFVSSNFFELYILCQSLNVPFGFEAALGERVRKVEANG